MGFVMVAGAGSNLDQQFGIAPWAGALLCSVLIVLVAFLDIDKITGVLGIFTPIMAGMILLITLYTFWGKTYDFTALDMEARTITPVMSNLWICIGVIVMVAALSLFANIDKVKDADMPMLAIVNHIHPALAVIYAVTVFALIFNTAFSLFYSIAVRFAGGDTLKLRKCLIGIVIVGYVCSFGGFKRLIGLLYPVLGYMGIVLLVVLLMAWIREREKIIFEKNSRRKMIRISLKKHDPEKEVSPEEKKLFHTLVDISPADSETLKSDIGKAARRILDGTDDTKTYAENNLPVDQDLLKRKFQK